MNTFYGNGAATSKAAASAANSNNFGLGLLGASQNNLIENNKLGGNINGVYLGAGGSVIGNVIRRNVILGHPNAEAIREFGVAIGADIQDFSAPGTNTFEDNRCEVYTSSSSSAPNPCTALKDDDDEDRDLAAFRRDRLAFPRARLIDAVFHPGSRPLLNAAVPARSAGVF